MYIWRASTFSRSQFRSDFYQIFLFLSNFVLATISVQISLFESCNKNYYRDSKTTTRGFIVWLKNYYQMTQKLISFIRRDFFPSMRGAEFNSISLRYQIFPFLSNFVSGALCVICVTICVTICITIYLTVKFVILSNFVKGRFWIYWKFLAIADFGTITTQIKEKKLGWDLQVLFNFWAGTPYYLLYFSSMPIVNVSSSLTSVLLRRYFTLTSR